MIKLGEYEKSVLFKLIEKTTGCHQSGSEKKQLFISNIESLMKKEGFESFSDFLSALDSSAELYNLFISSVTIHTTYWFREPEHFKELEKILIDKITKGQTSFSFWSAACSTGQELYTTGLVFEKIKESHPHINYLLLGSDIDLQSALKAKKAIYPISEMSNIPSEYHRFLMIGSGKLKGYFTLNANIRQRTQFKILNLHDENYQQIPNEIDFAFCRNILIYFHPSQVGIISRKIISHLKTSGLLFLGHSEPINQKVFGLKNVGSCIYEKTALMKNGGDGSKQVRPVALIVDDVPTFRVIICKALENIGFECLEANSAEEATTLLKSNQVDFVTLDLHLPGQNGADWLRDQRMAGYQIPAIVISGSSSEEAQAVYGALSVGAKDYIEKSKLLKNLNHLTSVAKALVQKSRPDFFVSTQDDDVDFIPPKPDPLLIERTKRPEIFVIGASTGGPDAIWRLLKNFPQPCPPIVIVQHVTPYFANQFAQTVSQISGLRLGATQPDTPLEQNTLYIADGDYHLEIKKNSGDKLVLQISKEPVENGHRPAVDILFRSLAKLKVPSISAQLTGMGADGAKGLLELYQSGWSYTLAQSRDSCVVYGMPKEAIMLGAVHQVGDLDWIRCKLIESSQNQSKKAA